MNKTWYVAALIKNDNEEAFCDGKMNDFIVKLNRNCQKHVISSYALSIERLRINLMKDDL